MRPCIRTWQNKSAHVGLAMTTLVKVWMPYLVSTMLTCKQEELNVVEGSACNYSHPMWKPTSYTMVAKMLWIVLWVLVCSLPWAQRKRWIPIKSIGCVHTHWRLPKIEGWGSPSRVQNNIKKLRENNQKVGKISQIVSQVLAPGPEHDKIRARWALNLPSKNILERV
jgi:hypothetical protein